jgi:hypothetical protein
MTVDPDFATRLVDATLGAGAFRAPRGLGPAERGMLAGILGGALQPLGWSIGLGRLPPVAAGAAQVCLRLETPVATGRLWLPIAAAGAEPVSRGVDAFRQRARRLTVVASVRIAATDIAVGDLAALTPGDAVVFDGYGADDFRADAAWPGELAMGEWLATHAAPVHIDTVGGITLAGGFEGRGDALPVHGKEIEMNASGSTEVTAALAAAPIEVVAELGRIRLRGEEVLGLAAELVDVDGELGVRVIRMAGR